jgi:hypothetical protein
MPALAPILAALAGLGGLEWWLRRRERRTRKDPEPPTAPDWSSIKGYVELAQAARQAHWLAADAFLDGPFRRFLEICSAPGDPPRARARMMEFGRAAFAAYRDSQAERGADPVVLEVRARAMAASWFSRPDVPNGDYMLEVFDGISNHNWRGTRE